MSHTGSLCLPDVMSEANAGLLLPRFRTSYTRTVPS